MICIECSSPDIRCLYSDFKSNFIRLTICRTCGSVADKYIEYDKVILFLDVLLLKPSAYRHAAYNLVEEEIFSDIKNGNKQVTENSKNSPTTEGLGGQTKPESFSDFNPARYNKLRRFLVLSILFEVYLEWAYEEKSAWNSQMISLVLQAPPLWQYAFFIVQQCIAKVSLCLVMVFLFTDVLQFGSIRNTNLPPQWNVSYHRCVLIVTILMALAVKSLPIIMLIWPYDNATVANSVVSILGLFNTIEGLKVVTNRRYVPIVAVTLASNLLSVLASQIAMCAVVGSVSSGTSVADLLRDEFWVATAKVWRLYELVWR